VTYAAQSFLQQWLPSILSFAGGVAVMLVAEWYRPWREERLTKKRLRNEIVASAAHLTYVAYNRFPTLSNSSFPFSYLNHLKAHKPELLGRIDVHGHYQQIVSLFAKVKPDIDGPIVPIDKSAAINALQGFYGIVGLMLEDRRRIERLVRRQANMMRTGFGESPLESPWITKARKRRIWSVMSWTRFRNRFQKRISEP
jgi:hypothetical protein